MNRRRLLAVGAAVMGLLAFTSSAGAATLGITAPPTGATNGTDTGVVIAQLADVSSTPFIVPSGGGQITQWQTLTAGDTPGSSLTFLVLRPTGNSGYTVIGADTETIPSPLPSSGVASFVLSHPIMAQAGDTLGLYSSVTNVTYFYNGTVPPGDNVFAAAGPTSVGQTVTIGETGSGNYEMNLAATLDTTEEASIQTSVYPSVAELGSPAVLSSTVTDAGPASGSLTFVDGVPSGVEIQSASADYGSCTVSGQTVTCTLDPAVGKSATVNVIVTPTQVGSFANTATVTTDSGHTDPTTADNSVTANLVVAALPQKCIVPALKKLPVASARTVLGQLGCKVTVVSKHSSLAKGLVIGSLQAPGTYPYQQLITLTVSSGPKHKKHRKHKH